VQLDELDRRLRLGEQVSLMILLARRLHLVLLPSDDGETEQQQAQEYH
jgi:hypothetical protein